MNIPGQSQNQAPFGAAGNQQQLPLFSGNASNGSMPASMPPSPQKDQWSETTMEQRAMPKRMRPHSPALRSQPEMTRRGDGIRKKNARFEIPAERNLTNIDQLIAQSTDEQEIKELKQQKRLLRNRQAALDSRQRKKQHTERLEDEKKHYTALINDLEEDLAEAKLTLDEFAHKEQQYQQYLESMQLEKEEMVRNHTIETGDLRKKISVLTEHIQRLESAHPTAGPSTNGFSSDYADIDSLTMDGAWDNISFVNDFAADGEVKTEGSLVPSKKVENSLLSDPEKPAAQGLLLMLLLFGAFVASKGSSPSIPQMSDDVRAASATLLEDIFKDAGVSQAASGVAEAVAPLPSGGSWSAGHAPSTGEAEMSGMASSTLGDLTDSLVQPTEEQNREQLFSLSAAQYNGLVSPDFMQNVPPRSTSQGRRNLGETLAAMRHNSKNSAAEVYTRSLLWDQVPSEVVRNFAKLVSESNARNRQDQRSTAG
ncbi:hypothetical protein OIDMADRAFT_129628 [Oidiodendron maius Zn]|uniref:BZIP domain-containing protein n=1 Tax=Oidiodendron maius (strain Zn) TaxID=913774 RepID=A0A0C3GNP8_OIDMZ|nr:hypothetical protein OIDMADRAFT_129628 [Oidiodendron maius Zn]